MAHRLSALANPHTFMKWTGPAVPIAGGIAVVSLIVGTALAFFFSPPDYKQGESVRIMYVHVPAAWLAMQTYAVIAVSSFVGFVWRHRLADLVARASAPIGLGFTVLALLTGALWGKVTWGVYWDWDPRMTSVLVLMFLYIGYIALWQVTENEHVAARNAALLAMVGAINLPIIKFSVDWWESLHQQATVIREGGPSMPASMLWPLMIMAVAYVAIYSFYLLLRVRTELRSRSVASKAPVRAPSRAILQEETGA